MSAFDTPHAIYPLAMVYVVAGPGGKGWIFNEAGHEVLVQALEKLATTGGGLRHAVTSLVSLAKHFDDRGYRERNACSRSAT